MQTTQTTEGRNKPQTNRSHIVRRNNRTGSDGSGETGVDHTIFSESGFHLLDLSPKPLFEISMMTGVPHWNDKGLLDIINTEAKQLQAIGDLYSIVKAQPKYKNLKEPNWTESTSPIKVLNWLLRKLGPLAKGDNWTVDTYDDKGVKRYRFVVYRYYHSPLVKNRQEFMPLDFLPGLLKRDKPLHDMIIAMVALVSKINKIPLWDEDGDYSKVLEDIISQDDSHNERLYLQQVSYREGLANHYLKLIKKVRRSVTVESVEKIFRSYNNNSERKHSIIWWIKAGFDLVSKKQSIHKNTYVPDFIKGNPVTPYRLYKFIWSSHDNDYVNVKARNRLKKDNELGSLIPIEFSITKPGQKVKPIVSDSFPKTLYAFMSHGVSHVLWRYRQYYYRNQLNEQRTPAESLLERIELSEIQNLTI